MSILKEMISFGRLNECFAVANGDVLIDSKFEPTMIDIRVSIKVSKKDYLKALEKQISKGIAKYGKDIDECPTDALDWKEEALSEIIDAAIYLLQDEKYEKEIEGNN